MADIKELTEDLALIQKLGDNPNTDNGLSAAELKAEFDKAPLIIQKYINEVVVPGLKKAILADGTTPMTGTLHMSGHKVIGLGAPTEDGDAIPKGYVVPVEEGGTDANNAADALLKLGAFPASSASHFRSYAFYPGSGFTLIQAIQNNWTDMEPGMFMCYVQSGGQVYGAVGQKVNEYYGTVISLGYQHTTPVFYRNLGGVWSETAL